VCKLTVGPDIKLKGAEITDCDTLVVEGRVEASMDSRVIQIAESGVFIGKVGIDVAEIHGRFEGELTAHRQLVIHASGRVSGTIRYGTISIEKGGELSGDVAAIPSTRSAAPAAAADHNRTPAPHAASAPASQALTATAAMRAATGR
jgi:cytoskeletal protein CcmA (bactofilin family)